MRKKNTAKTCLLATFKLKKIFDQRKHQQQRLKKMHKMDFDDSNNSTSHTISQRYANYI